MKKKILSILLAVCLIAACLPMAANAAGDFYIDENGVLRFYFGKDTHVVIPKGVKEIGPAVFGAWVGSSELEEDWKPVVINGTRYDTFDDFYGSIYFDQWYYWNNEKIESITVPDGVTKIGAYAFSECSKLKNITIPESVTEVGEYAFWGTPWLNNQGLVIRNDTVIACGNKSSTVTIPKTVKKIVPEAFYNVGYTNTITTVIIEPGELTKLEPYSFHGFDDLQKLYIPPTVTEIDAIWGEWSGPPEGLTIYGAPGSTAEAYAKGWKLPFVSSYVPYPGTSFYDVPQNAYYGEAVKWAVDNDITSGTDSTHFSPKKACTRGEAVTFLWRAAGSPEPAGDIAFTDVKSGAYYEKAVRWAVERGIASGTGSGKFSPGMTCDRAQIVTFLYRAKNQPEITEESSFTDVEAGRYYENAVKWAVENGITSGTGSGKFSPGMTCDRAQIVTFLYRYSK